MIIDETHCGFNNTFKTNCSCQYCLTELRFANNLTMDTFSDTDYESDDTLSRINKSKEPILDEQEYSVFGGIRFKDIEEFAEKQEKSRWRENEISFVDDYEDFRKLPKNTQELFKRTLSFLAVSDGLINKNLITRFLNEVTDPSARRFYLFQACMEDVHARTYGLMLAAIVPDRAERQKLMEPHKHSLAIRAKINWIEKWIEGDYPFCQRIVAFAIAEGIFFQPSFVPFHWAKKNGLMPGLSKGNEFIARDEGMHCYHGLLINKNLITKCSEETIHEMMEEAVRIEQNYAREEMLRNGGIIEINVDALCRYVEYSADRWLSAIACAEKSECSKIYGCENPFPWMEKISIPTYSEFFERSDSNYKDRFGNDPSTSKFAIDCDF